MLRPYTNQQGLDTGSDTFTPAPNLGAAIGSGFASLGQGIGQYASAEASADLAIAGKQEQMTERAANYRDQFEYDNLNQRIQNFSQQQQAKLGSDGAGYAKSVEQYAREQEEELLQSGRLSSNNDAKHQAMFGRIYNGNVKAAADFEFKKQVDFRMASNDKKVQDIVAGNAFKGAGGLDGALAEWRDYNKNTEGDTPIGREILKIGTARIKAASLEAEATGPRGPEFLAKVQGAMSETPSANTANPMVNAILKYGPINQVDPRTLAAIGYIESGLNPNHDGPRLSPGAPQALGRKGATHMSSAEGGWQYIDSAARAAGLSLQDKFDPEKSTAAFARDAAGFQAKLKSLGYEPTDGRTYMMYNVGEGVALNILKADPNTPIQSVIYASYPSRPEFAAQVLRNNPSLYRPGMTAGQVVQSYEGKMANARKATEGYFNGSSPTTDDQLRSSVQDFMGGQDMSELGRKEIADIFVKSSQSVQKQTTEERNIAAGAAYMANPGTGDPYDGDRQSKINALVDRVHGPALTQNIATGDDKALVTARDITRTAGFMPDRVVNGFKAAIASNQTTPTMLALQQLSDISRTDPVAYKATKGLGNDEKEMAADYRALTEVSGISPAAATQYLIEGNTPEGKQRREASKQRFLNEWKNGGTEVEAKDRDWAFVKSKFDQSVWSSPNAVSDNSRDVITDMFGRSVLYHRLQGKSLDEAQTRAVHDLKQVWGVSTVAGDGGQTLTMLPPEKVLGDEKRLDGGFGWVRDQASNRLSLFLAETGQAKLYTKGSAVTLDPSLPLGNAPGTLLDAKSVPKFQLVPQSGSASDFLQGQPVGYEIWYEDKKGLKQKVVGQPFYPDYVDAKARSDQEFLKRERDRKSRLTVNSDGSINDPAPPTP